MVQFPHTIQSVSMSLNAGILYILGHKVALTDNVYQTSLHGKGHHSGHGYNHLLVAVPETIDEGTYGCPVPNGAVLAGASKKENAMWLYIIDLRYRNETVRLTLPFSVKSLCMVYDDVTDVLTIAGGTGVDDQEPDPSKQVWQIKLFEKDSKWLRMPLLEQGVYDPVLFSDCGVVYIVGGYTQPNLKEGTTRCLKLPIGEDWEDIGELPKPLSEPGHRGGVLWTPTNPPARRVLIVFTDDRTFHYDLHHTNSKSKKWWEYTHGENLLNCTPVLGSDGKVYVSLKYKEKGKEMFDVGEYNPVQLELKFLKDKCFMELDNYRHIFNPGYFLAPIL